jgi:lathosterol oxidase
MILLHNVWFYFTHRFFMHNTRLFRLIHRMHLRSVNPSPFAALSFHPLESEIETGAYVVFTILITLYQWALYV